MKCRLLRRSALFLSLALSPLIAHCLVVEGYDPQVNDRFSAEFPDKVIPNVSRKFVGAGIDWSGVGWRVEESEYSATMVTPRHFVCAAHYPAKVNGTIGFFNRDGQLKTYVVERIDKVPLGKDAKGEPTYSDLAIGTLTDPIPVSDHISYYPVLTLGDTISRYLGQKLLMYGKVARVGVNSIVDGLLIRGLSSEYQIESGGMSQGMSKCESGDSGGGSFALSGARLAIVGVHRTPEADTLIAGLIPEANRILAADGYKLEVISGAK